MAASDSVSEAVRERARAAAGRAADRAGIAIREVHELADCVAVRALFDTLWGSDPTNPVATVELLRAFAHSGQYVVLADDLTRPGRPVVASSIGFLAAPAGQALHSNVTGVLPPGRGRSLGFAVKLHQRAWALDRGLTDITWTFDPLIRRNAWLNLAKLGTVVREYHVDFYGAMGDGINAGDASDRLYLGWPLAAGRVEAAADGRPRVADVDALRTAGAVEVLTVNPDGGPGDPRPLPAAPVAALAQVPPDIEAVRATDRGAARAWRAALRAVLGGALTAGWRVSGVGRDGFYVLERAGEPAPEED